MYEFEQQAVLDGFTAVAGVDEAGRGPLAGDVYAAAVILPVGLELEGINDSKKLSEKKREALYSRILDCGAVFCVAFASVEEIERLNILQASLLAMRRAVEGLGASPDLVLVDGNRDPQFGGPETRLLVHGDGRSASIAAASILAKVERDQYMRALDAAYPQYAFAQHKGYGTRLHYRLLEQYGISPIHRKSFLKSLKSAVPAGEPAE